MTTQRREQVVPIVLRLLGVETRFLMEMMWRIIRLYNRDKLSGGSGGPAVFKERLSMAKQRYVKLPVYFVIASSYKCAIFFPFSFLSHLSFFFKSASFWCLAMAADHHNTDISDISKPVKPSPRQAGAFLNEHGLPLSKFCYECGSKFPYLSKVLLRVRD